MKGEWSMAELWLESPLEGELLALKEVNDPAFAGELMGRGAAVKSPQGKVVAPFDGEVTVLFPTKHAIGLHSVDGVDLLVHVGLDTVNLEGKYFTAHVEQGAKIRKGDVLIEFDEAAIRAAGYDTTTPVVVTNAADYGKITLSLGAQTISSGGEEAEERLRLSLQGQIPPTPRCRRRSAWRARFSTTSAAWRTSARRSIARRGCASS